MDVLRRGFSDITAGFTRSFILKRPAFIKHLNYADQMDCDRVREDFFNEAKRDGIQTNEEKLKVLKEQGFWSDAKEREMKDITTVIEGMIEGKKLNVKMPSLVQKYNQQIKAEEEKYALKMMEKNQLLGLTCESYAERQLNDYYIFANLFSNKELSAPLFLPEEFDYFDDLKVSEIVKDYNLALEPCSEHNIKKLAMEPFFQNYLNITGENLYFFFGKPISSLTFFQVRLLNHGQHYRYIYQNHDTSKFPKNVLDDPDLFSDYASTASNAKKEMEARGVYDQDAINIGVRDEDAKVLGIKTKNNLATEIAKSGGNVIDWAMKRG
jgi:hypothetical protein